ncbi:hypothetical protein EC973_003354 [Apophysomyces ossiformis]|uniref:Centrosomin N-terminal motif 1 domain-containing protein n=1 Tax=Apophysomyces ossiformis TaxID=679940 RepID=A0A8H7BZX5_9FUNG|nr:hypothetical protein EC973_003354 [Apophysomyces ossiformis]
MLTHELHIPDHSMVSWVDDKPSLTRSDHDPTHQDQHLSSQLPRAFHEQGNNEDILNPSSTGALDAQLEQLEGQPGWLDQDDDLKLQLEMTTADEFDLPDNQGTLTKHIPKEEPSNNNDAQKARKAKPSMKDQDKIIDSQRKEIFELKLRIFHLQNTLTENSPEQINKSLKENVDLKVKLRVLLVTVKKYKQMILGLGKALDNLAKEKENAPPQGMSEEEKAEYETALAQLEKYREENGKLHELVAKLRSSVSSQPTTLVASPLMMPSDNEEHAARWLGNHHRTLSRDSEVEMYRKQFLQAKQTIDKKDRELKSLYEEINFRSAGHDESHILKSILSDRDTLVTKVEQLQKTNVEMEQTMDEMKEKNVELTSQLFQKDRDLDKMGEKMDELAESLRETQLRLRCKTSEFDHMRKERMQNASDPEVINLLDRLKQLQQDYDVLYMEFEEQREQIVALKEDVEQRTLDCDTLEREMEKVMEYADKLENAVQEKDRFMDELEAKLERMSQLSRYKEDNVEERIDCLERELARKTKQLEEYKKQMEHWQGYDNVDVPAMTESFAEVGLTMQQKDARLKEMQEELEEILFKAKEARKQHEMKVCVMERKHEKQKQEIHERDVVIASLKGDLAAHKDTAQRETEVYREEIIELQKALHGTEDLIKEKDAYIEELQLCLKENSAKYQQAREDFENELSGLKKQESDKLIASEDMWKGKVAEVQKAWEEARRRLKLNRKMIEQYESQLLTLKQRLTDYKEQNRKLIQLNDQYWQRLESKGFVNSNSAESLLHKLNKELQRALDDSNLKIEDLNDIVETLRKKYTEISLENQRLEEENGGLQKTLARRDRMLTTTATKAREQCDLKEIATNAWVNKTIGGVSLASCQDSYSMVE